MPAVYAECAENQIDINSAQLEELDELYGIGEVKAQAIMDSRPYDSIEDLIDVKGIGEITLEKIKEQGLACVDKEKTEETEIKEESEEEIKEETEEKSEDKKEEKILYEENNKTSAEEKPIEIIKLNAKNIKTEIDEEIKEETKKSNYSLYGLAGFCVLLCFLFVLRRKKYKNEFD